MLDFLNQSVFDLVDHKPKGHISGSGAINSRWGMRAGRDHAFRRREGELGQDYCLITCDTEWSIESSDRWTEYEACDMEWAKPLGLARFRFPVINSLSDLIDNPTFDFDLDEVASYWEFGSRRSVFKTLLPRVSEYHPVYLHGGPMDGERLDIHWKNQDGMKFPSLPPQEVRSMTMDGIESAKPLLVEEVRYRREIAAIGRFEMPVMVHDKLSPESLNEWLQQPGSFAKLL